MQASCMRAAAARGLEHSWAQLPYRPARQPLPLSGPVPHLACPRSKHTVKHRLA